MNNKYTKILNVLGHFKAHNSQKNDIHFIGEGNLWVVDTYDRHMHELIRTLIRWGLENTAVNQLEVIGFDNQLNGLFAPFSSHTSGEHSILEILIDMDEFSDLLDRLKNHIFSVQNIIRGEYESLTTYRLNHKKAIESYKLVVLYLNISRLNDEMYEQLFQVVNAGPKAGVSFIIVGNEGHVNYKSFFELAGNFQMLRPGSKSFSLVEPISKLPGDFGPSSQLVETVPYLPYSTEQIVQFNEHLVLEKQDNNNLPQTSINESQKEFRFDENGELIDPNNIWNEIDDHGTAIRKSTYGVKFTIGTYGDEPFEVTLGDEINQRHNALITGAVGQGKSNLISVIIHSLVMNYDPRELELYLLDYKEGVSLKPYIGSDGKNYLPHATAIGLESDIGYGLSVLEHLYDVYKKRMKLFKDKNVKSLKEYREKYPTKKLTRIVVIIDEFQLMFGEDSRFAEKVSGLLEKSVRLYRAAGINFILASQSIAGNTALAANSDQIFSQIPIRVAHKNSSAESQKTLGMGNNAATTLKPREAIVNQEYGDIHENKKVLVAYADEKILMPIRKILYDQSINKGITKAPKVFDSEFRIKVSNKLKEISDNVDRNGQALIGQAIDVEASPAKINFVAEYGENLLLLGTSNRRDNNIIGILESIIYSISFKNTDQSSITIFDFRTVETNDEQNTTFNLFVSYISKTFNINIKFGEAKNFLSEIEQIFDEQQNNKNHYVVCLAMDRANFTTNDIYNAPLTDFLNKGPLLGIHFIGWWIKNSNLVKHVGDLSPKAKDLFNKRILFNAEPNAIQEFTTLMTKWEANENRAMYFDAINDVEPRVIIPYTALLETDIDELKKEK